MAAIVDEVALIAPTLHQEVQPRRHEAGEVPHVTSIRDSDFEWHGGVVAVSLETASGRLRFTLKPETLLALTTASVAFVNLHLGEVFQSLGL